MTCTFANYKAHVWMFQRAYVEIMQSGWAVNGHFSDAGPGFHPKKQGPGVLGCAGARLSGLALMPKSRLCVIGAERLICLEKTFFFLNLIRPKWPKNTECHTGPVLFTELEGNAKCAWNVHSLSTSVKPNLILCNGPRDSCCTAAGFYFQQRASAC